MPPQGNVSYLRVVRCLLVPSTKGLIIGKSHRCLPNALVTPHRLHMDQGQEVGRTYNSTRHLTPTLGIFTGCVRIHHHCHEGWSRGNAVSQRAWHQADRL